MTIVIDSNLWVSALLSQGMRNRLERLIENPDIVILGSPVLLAEVESVIDRPKFNRYFSKEITSFFLDILTNRLDIIIPTSNVMGFSDVKDNFLLNLAKDGNAEFILTGDKQLLENNSFDWIKIISIREFENYLQP